MKLTSKELEARFRKARSPIVVEISSDFSLQARKARLQEFLSDLKRSNPQKSLLLIALDG